MKFSTIRERLPLVTYLEDRLQWRHVRAKGGRRGACPICHRVRGKPFWIDTTSQRWFCHGCKRKGDVIDLHAQVHGMFLTIAATELSASLL